MPNETKVRFMTEAEYLLAEEMSTIRHEYVDGFVFAMCGSTKAHNRICMNIGAFLHGHLRDASCCAYMNDVKAKVESGKKYYYPDIMVSCGAFEPQSVFEEFPVLLMEVLSPSTRQIDQREKLAAYQKIPTLKEYVIVYQDRQQVVLYRREDNNQWESTLVQAGGFLELASLAKGTLQLPMSTIYEGYDPPGRVKEDEGEYDPASDDSFDHDVSEDPQ